MKDYIEAISSSFIKEAIASPRMLEDLAAMEKYMSESYDGRTFVELIQNADDANSNRIRVEYVGKTLIVANDGRSFNADDITAICRSGASKKERGKNIGYRGVGFKSATTISTEIIIYSADVYFTFSKSLCAETLAMDENSVPTVRIPFLFNESNLDRDVLSKIEELDSDGFTTCFIFRNAHIEKFKKEIAGFNSGWLLFLKKLSNVEINLPRKNIICKVSRKKYGSDILVKIVGTKEQWYITENDGASLAFKYDDETGIMACNTEDAVFHCYLPTIDKTGFPFKINADFSTDPSRKHIIADEITQASLEKIGALFVDFVNKITVEKESDKIAILSLLMKHISLGDMVSKLEQQIENRLRIDKWVLKNNGEITSAQNVTFLPNWLTQDEKNALVNAIPYMGLNLCNDEFYSGIEKIENMLSKYGAVEVSQDVLRGLICGPDSARAIGTKITAKIFVYCYREFFLDKAKIGEVFVPTNSGYVQLSEVNDYNEIDAEFLSVLMTILNPKERADLSDNYHAFEALKRKSASIQRLKTLKPVSVTKEQKTMAINKWKSPVQNCLAAETFEGRSGKDVSRKCDEYNIESVNARGEATYIAVKQVKSLGDSFSLSEGEYAAAQRLGDAYKVFVISMDGDEVEYIYITNPVATLRLDKVVKEWEFLCNTYNVREKTENVIKHDDSLIDQKFLKCLLPEYFNSKQRAFLKDFIKADGMHYDKSYADMVEKINGVVDFYTGSSFLEVKNDEIVADVSKINAVKKVLYM